MARSPKTARLVVTGQAVRSERGKMAYFLRSQSPVKVWSTAYVALAVTMSAALNGHANSLNAPEGMGLPAWGMGVAIPVLVLILGKVASGLYRKGRKELALGLTVIGSGLLFLSVFHCQQSISLLTGSHWLLASLLAIGIDCGFVGCEVATTLSD